MNQETPEDNSCYK